MYYNEKNGSKTKSAPGFGQNEEFAKFLDFDEQEKVINKIVNLVDKKTSQMYTYYVPGSYEFRYEAFPYTSVGKIAYKELEKANEIEYEKTGKN